MSYRQYCRRYSEWADSKNLTFHIQRYPGVNLELDYAGKQLKLHNQRNPVFLLICQKNTKIMVTGTYRKVPKKMPVQPSLDNPKSSSPISGIYKDDDSSYSLKSLLKRQEEGHHEEY